MVLSREGTSSNLGLSDPALVTVGAQRQKDDGCIQRVAVGLAGEEVQSRLEIHSGLCWAAGRGLGRGPRGSPASGVRSGASGDIRRDRDAGRGRGPRGGRGRRCRGAVPGGQDRDVRVFVGTIRQLTYSYPRFADDGSAAQEGHPAGCLSSQDMDPEPWPLEVTPHPHPGLRLRRAMHKL